MLAYRSNDYCVVSCGDNIRKFISKYGVTQREIAKAMGYSQSHISAIIKGKAKPTVKFYLAWSFIRARLLIEANTFGVVEVC